MGAHEWQIRLEKISIVVITDETFSSEELPLDGFGVIAKILRMMVRANNVCLSHAVRLSSITTVNFSLKKQSMLSAIQRPSSRAATKLLIQAPPVTRESRTLIHVWTL